ncbi:Phospholipase C [Podila minutissima]|uniref:Phosphoinositide phospholipase C n=1 Tax=Podila minutissima TaxID=64525 RepID=A0A9P5VKA5_9FUNG|nr:Phospholipase C [Podila minutissima]
MFDKIKRAISGWSQDSPASGKDKDKLKLSPPPLRQHSTLVKKESKSPNAFRNSLPARFRNSVYQDLSSSSEVLPLPTSTSSSSPLRDDTFSSPSPSTSPVTPTLTSPSQAPETETTHEASPLAQTSPRPIPKVASSSPDLMTGSPKKLYITRASSFQSKESSEMRRSEDAAEDKDIIIFSSTPPVSINRSASVKIPRKGVPSLHKGSPDHNYALPSSFGSMNQETPVVQWPRGGASSAANRSQEHFLRSHRRTSTSSDASIKDLQTSSQIATTPPVTSILRQESIQRPSLDRQTSRSGAPSGDIKHKKTPSDASAESLPMDSSGASAGVVASAMTDSPSSSSGGPSLNSSPAIEQPQRLASSSTDAETPKAETLPPLNPTVSRQLALGTQMLKISAKKQHSRLFKLDLEQGRILWDSRKLGRINVEQIKELRKGKAARMYREQLRVKPEHEERWLTIIYSASGKYKALHLVAPTKDTYHDWIMAVERMWSVKREVAEGLPQLQRKTNQWLKEHWMDADKNVDSKLGYEEVVRLCHRLNINFSRKEIRHRFDQADEKKQGYLDFADFTHFVKLLKERREIVTLFNRVAKSSDSLTIDQFTDFMEHTQKSTLDRDQIHEIYGKHLDKTVEKFTVDSLTSFLLSVDNSVVAPAHTQVHQDMSQTLSNYYISSSHNTYLLGHQLTGVSSIEGYIRALQSGCRCVELDCWDGSDGQPVIYHGRTLTSKILFRDVIETISTYAFVNSPYPLILSLEIHCDLDQQEIMANTMRNKLGSWLVVAPLDAEGVVLPSPDDLKFKILVKSKVLPPDAQAQEYSTDTESESEKESENDSDNAKQPKPKTKKKIRIARALSDITIYCQSRHFPGFTHDGCQPHKIISFSERVSLRLGKQNLQEYINMNKSHLVRVYPAGFRINSTNYDPHHHWAAGCQVVALNYQNHDRGMQMNRAMFTMNGHCGYVLKPAPLRLASGEVCNHDKAPSFVKSYPLDITIEVISAQQLPRPNDATSGDVVDPVCEVELLVPGQSAVKFKTRHVNDNGFNPVWRESFKFRVDYEFHELVFFRFVVQDEDLKFSDMIASYCISLDCLQEGYRHIQLHDPSGDPYLYSTLFVKVSIESAKANYRQPLVQQLSSPSFIMPPTRQIGATVASTSISIDSSSNDSGHDEPNQSRPLPPVPQLPELAELKPLQIDDLPPLPPTPPPK